MVINLNDICSPVSPIKFLPMNAKVSALIDLETKWWNLPLLHSVFRLEEVEVISSIPLSKYGQPYLLIWRGSTTGAFTVRSAYYLEKQQEV